MMWLERVNGKEVESEQGEESVVQKEKRVE